MSKNNFILNLILKYLLNYFNYLIKKSMIKVYSHHNYIKNNINY